MTIESIEILKGYRERLLASPSNQLGADIKAFDKAIQLLESQRWIPQNPTNGDMIISLYPNLKYYVKDDRIITTIGVASSFDLDWWNAPYKGGKNENIN